MTQSRIQSTSEVNEGDFSGWGEMKTLFGREEGSDTWDAPSSITGIGGRTECKKQKNQK